MILFFSFHENQVGIYGCYGYYTKKFIINIKACPESLGGVDPYAFEA